MNRDAAREGLLLATLRHAPFDGWTAEALAAGAADAGLAPADAERLFPGGAGELVGCFSDWADARMLAAMAAGEDARPRLQDRVKHGVRARCEALAPHREAARAALSFFARPGNAPLGIRCLYRTVDRIWYAAGDRSADFSYYTKRGLLAAVYSATVLFWLEDGSAGCAESWRFLDRRIAETMRLQKLRARARRAADGLPDPLRLLRRAG